MSFNQIKNRRIEETKILLSNVEKIIDKYAKQIAQKNIVLLKQEDINWDASVSEYLDIFYDLLEEIYSSVSKSIKEIYNISFKKETIEDIIDNLTYQEDGLTLKDRIEKHFNGYKDNKPTKERMLYDLMKIANTEGLSVMNSLIKNKIKEDFEYAMVEETECCDICSDWVSEGPIPVDDFEEPPYHPNCECIAVYFTSDEIED